MTAVDQSWHHLFTSSTGLTATSRTYDIISCLMTQSAEGTRQLSMKSDLRTLAPDMVASYIFLLFRTLRLLNYCCCSKNMFY